MSYSLFSIALTNLSLNLKTNSATYIRNPSTHCLKLNKYLFQLSHIYRVFPECENYYRIYAYLLISTKKIWIRLQIEISKSCLENNRKTTTENKTWKIQSGYQKNKTKSFDISWEILGIQQQNDSCYVWTKTSQ